MATALLSLAVMVRAQEPDSPPPDSDAKPKPAARAIPSIDDTDSSVEPNPDGTIGNWKPDNTPLTGLEVPTLGNPDLRHSYIVPGLQFGSNVQSAPITSASGANTEGWYSTEYLGWSLSALKGWSNSQFALAYSGGAAITSQPGQNNGTYQQLSAGQNFQWQRWQLQWTDQFSYIPQTQFGFGGSTSLGIPGIGGALNPSAGGLGGSVVPSQSIYTAIGPRYSNAAVVQASYQLNARQSITASGSYGLLNFTQSGNVNTDDWIGNVGYNYLLTAKDTIGVVYRFTAYHYEGQPQALGDTVVSLAYGRKITRRMALQLFGGPDRTTFRVPVGTSTSRISGSASASLKYAFQRGDLSVNYVHGLGGGSGVLTGAEMDELTFGASHRIGRVWTVNGTFGFADNRTLSGSNSTIPTTSFKSWYLGGGVSRPFTKAVDFSLAYTASINQPSISGCTTANCNASTTQNTITVFVQWHARPFVIE
jgi:hypothetical protein